MHGLFRFNSYSELTFTVGRTYIDSSSHIIAINPYYDKIEALRLVELEHFGYFEIQDPEIVIDGIQEVKNITAFSLEYSLSQKYLENFYINTGENNSLEVVYAKDKNNNGIIESSEIDSIVFYNATAFTEYDQKHSLLHLVLEKTYGWSIGHVDASLRTMSRKFEMSRGTIYDFIMQDICDKFNCFVVFDTMAKDENGNRINTINFYAEAPIVKFKGDGSTKVFNISPAFDSIDTVTIDSYKTTKYTYNHETGVLTLEDAPADCANIEVKDGSQVKYSTDVYVTFDNLAQEVNISYSADDIKTVLTVKGADDLDIREVNMGLQYITDFSYYYSVDWMGQDLYDAYTKYLKNYDMSQDEYSENSKNMLEYDAYMDYEENRLSLQYSIADYISSTTVGTYYVRGGNIILTSEQKEIAQIMKAEFDQTSIDLTVRPRVSWEKMHEAGWNTEEGSYSTLDTVTFLSSDFDIIYSDGNDYAINVTPILPNGYVISGGHDGLWNYINEQLQNGVSFQHMHDIFIGIYNSLEDAEAAAERLHILQEQFYQYGFPVPNYYYKEVQLPSEYSADVEHYYTLSGNDLNETKVSRLYSALQTYYASEDKKSVVDIDKLKEDFSFMESYTIDNLSADLTKANDTTAKDTAVRKFLDLMWEQVGKTPLEKLYKETYKQIKDVNVESGWNSTSNENYWRYYPVNLMIDSIDLAISARTEVINAYQEKYNALQEKNNNITSRLNLNNNFTSQQLIRLNSFWREDEYVDDNFIETESDTIDSLIKIKQELLECGRIELKKLCEPKLAFSMSMANIYALEEFEPIVDQFQLGNLINIEIRPRTKYESAYVKRARLLEVNVNFDDFSDFSCEFGELTNLKTPSSIHADLLAAALSAGKSVASSASYWDKGTDLATKTDLKIQQGLLNAIKGLYTSDQSVTIDNNGILLRKVNEDGSFSPYQAWIRNNTILLSSDGFAEGSVPRTGLGEFTVDGQTFYGILAEAMISGYIEGSTIVGGTINIGDGTFVVNSDGSVVMKAMSIDGYVEENGVISAINQSAEQIAINANKISLNGKNINLTSDNVTIDSTYFSVDKTGKITATSGEIAGWKIYESLLRKEITVNDVDYQMYLQAADGTTTSNAFAVRKKGPDDTDWDVQFAVNYAGKLTAKNANISGTITAKDGSIAGYHIGEGGCYANAIYKRVAGDSCDYEVGLKATNGDTDLAFYVKESADDWASNTNNFYIRNNGQLYANNAVITGEVNATSGNIGGCSISNGVLNVDAARITSGTIATARIPNLSADKITAGTIHVDRIPSLNADKITVGTLHADRIPNISASKITSGTINASNVSVTNLNASNITSGTLSTSRLSSSVITTDNFSSKSLSTGSLTVASGCRLGVSSEYNAMIRTVGDYTYIKGFGPDVNYETSFYNLVKYVVQNSSSKDIKSEIHDFDDRYNTFFDKLNPQLFRYNFEPNMGYTMGYVWQEAEQARIESGLERNDIGAITETDSVVGGLALSKQDFIALNTWQIQKLKARVEELENKLAALEA